MKNLLRIGLLALLPLFASAQITWPDVATQAQVRKINARIDSLNRSISGVKPVDPEVPVTPGKKDCPEGPLIKRIFDVSTNTVKFQFHGEGVYGIEYWIKDPSGKDVSHGLISPESSIIQLKFNPSGTGNYQLLVRGSTCNSILNIAQFYVSGVGVIVVPDPVKTSSSLGVYEKKVSGRTFTFNKTPELELSFEGGLLSDITPDLDKSAETHKIRDWNVFYAIDNYPLEQNSGEGLNIQNLYLPDGIYTVQQYVCRPNQVPDFARFKLDFEGWHGRWVNSDNARRSQIFLSIHSDAKQGISSVPDWLKSSRVITYLDQGNPTEKDWRPYFKFHGIGDKNLTDNIGRYHTAGVNTYFSSESKGDALWRTNRMPPYYNPGENELYGWGRNEAKIMGNSINASTTSEFMENTYGKDTTNLQARLVNYDRGFYDQIREVSGETDARKMGNFGDYGGDDWYGAFGAGLGSSYERFVESLTTKVHWHYYGPDDKWIDIANYYKSGQIDYRNLNKKLYYDNMRHDTPYELLYLNERVKIGTKTYEGLDRERNIILFTSPKTESFVFDASGRKIPIEYADTGEIIPFPGGEIKSLVNHQPPAPVGEMYNDALWYSILGGGVMNWDAGGTFGSDSTKLDAWDFEGVFSWRPIGSTKFNPYEPSLDGAPEKGNTGMIHRMYSMPLDAHLAAMETAWDIRNRTTKLSHVAYKSDRNSFVPVPGTTGLHLNGYGPLNYNQYNSWHIYHDKKAIALIGEGPEGKVIIYYNGFLSPNLKETVTVLGKTFEAYGRQTVIINL